MNQGDEMGTEAAESHEQAPAFLEARWVAIRV